MIRATTIGGGVIFRLAALIGSVSACAAVTGCTASTITPTTPTSTPLASVAATPTPTAVPTPAAAPTPSAVPVVGTGAAGPVIAVEDVAKVDDSTGRHISGDCNGATYLVPPCPVTQRFGARLDSHPFSGSGGGADPLCRCQGLPTPTFTLISQSGTTAYVHEDLGFGPSHDLRWIVVSIGGTWYVDDQDTGCSATTIYNPAYDFFSAGSTPPPPAPSC